MKAVFLLSLVALVSSAPQPRKLFHEHVEEFLNIIIEESGDVLNEISESYLEFEDFRATWEYIATANFRDLVYEMESLPEFQNVIDVLENDNVDIHYFLDLLNQMFEEFNVKKRQSVSGTNFHSYIKDIIAQFPSEKLSALFEEKMANDEEFSSAINNLASAEFGQALGALWSNEVFGKEIEVMEANGIILSDLFDELMAIFGQSRPEMPRK